MMAYQNLEERRRLKIGSRGLHTRKVLALSMISLTAKFEGGPLDRGFDFSMLYLGNGAR